MTLFKTQKHAQSLQAKEKPPFKAVSYLADKDFNAVLGEPIKDGVLKGFRVVNTKIR